MKPLKLHFLFIPLLALATWISINAFVEANISNVKIQKKPSIVFLVTEDTNNYKAHETIPKFATLLEKEYGYETTVLLGSGSHGDYQYPDVDALSDADLLVVFARRIALPHKQMKAIKNHVGQGKPVVGIRTAHHAFAVLDEKIKEGHEDWRAFTADVLGCENKGYGPHEAGYNVSVMPAAVNHPILKGIHVNKWHSKGGIYHVSLLDKNADVLLQGELNGKTEPVAWTRTTGKNKVFYTSLGYPDDFDTPQFRTLLINGMRWAMQPE
jgi:type 1 glutamine amidotransferase